MIKVIKRGSLEEPNEPELASEQETRRERESTVNEWIAERRENSRQESAYSANQIQIWNETSE